MTLFYANVHVHRSYVVPYIARELTPETLHNAITDLLVRRVIAYTFQGDQSYEVQLLMRRPTNREALVDILSGIERLGFAIGETLIVEYASTVTESAVSGFFGAGAIGAASRNPLVALLAAGAGAAAGAALGRLIHLEKARYQASWNPFTASWSVTQVAPPNGLQLLFSFGPLSPG